MFFGPDFITVTKVILKYSVGEQILLSCMWWSDDRFTSSFGRLMRMLTGRK